MTKERPCCLQSTEWTNQNPATPRIIRAGRPRNIADPHHKSIDSMQKNQTREPPKGFGPNDVFFVLFKHKWMIVVLAMAGLGAAAALHLRQQPVFQSTAKLLVRYVVESGAMDPYTAMKSPGNSANRYGDPVILTEIEILQSLDLAIDVATSVGIDRLLDASLPANMHDEPELVSAAAGVIASRLEVGTGASPNVLHITFGSTDRGLTRDVLNKLIEHYFKKHLDIHRSAAAFDMVSKQTSEVRQRLASTEFELNELRTRSGILSLADATESLSAQRARTQEDLMKARAELAEQEARINALAKLSGGGSHDGYAAARDAPPAISPTDEVPPQIVTEFRAVMEMLAILQKRDLELRIKFKPGNPLLVQNQHQIATYDQKRISMLNGFPGLKEEKNIAQPAETSDPRRALDQEKARLAAIRAKVEVFESHLREIRNLFSEQYAVGARIEDIERRKQLEDAEFRTLEVKLKEARLDQTLDPSRMPNITMVQQPSEPVKTFDEMMRKIILGLAGGGLATGIGLAFLIELVFNRKVERPMEIQARLQLPLLISIPYVRRRARGRLPVLNRGSSSLVGDRQADLPAVADKCSSGIDDDPDHFILPYTETIRDRIIFNFEVNNVIHKPKLVAVTGMTVGAGASTIAAGLAKSFAEIRGVKVLLVDLGSFHPQECELIGGARRHSLGSALKLARSPEFRERPQSLYHAIARSCRDDPDADRFTPLHLQEMMPVLQASDYDYIIFDMPPVAPTSRTLAMAGLMDKVLLVLDAGNTSREGLKWGYSELTKGRADVSCIFNKTRSHGPEWLVGGD
jgi:succinoglycan biosynthesis transport protein ExoP